MGRQLQRASRNAGLFYSETTVSGNASAAVTFTSKPPVVNSISSSCPRLKLGGICYDNSTNLFAAGYAVFSWSVVGADRYELYGPGGYLYYSGAATSVDLAGKVNHAAFQNGNWILRSYKGSSFTDTQYMPPFNDVTPDTPTG
jgi:hypothetical protein